MKDNSNSGGESQQTGVIYKITCLVNGKNYVGQTRQKLNRRIYGHKTNKGKSAIDVAIRKYGWENFSVEVLETCPVEKLNEREIFWIRELNSKAPNGYNLTDGGDTALNISEETRARMSAAKKGKPSNRKGLPLTEEHKAKIAASKKGTPAHNKGKHLSEAQKALLSAINKGKKYGPHSPETIAKIIESNKRTWARKKLENGGDK